MCIDYCEIEKLLNGEIAKLSYCDTKELSNCKERTNLFKKICSLIIYVAFRPIA